ncbi:MAG TPA: hypothetical protein VIL16_20855 [Trebonia sp.]
MSTKEELQAENERLGREVAALRTLLAAVRDCADVPFPAGGGDDDWLAFLNLSSRRADLVAVYGNPDAGDQPATVRTLHDRAESLRREAARPLRYAPKAAPAPVITDSERDCDQAHPETGAWCHRGGDHGVHRDTNGDEWRADGPVTRAEDIPDEMFGSPSSGLGYKS